MSGSGSGNSHGGLQIGRHYMFRRIGVRSSGSGSGSGSGLNNVTPAAVVLGALCPSSSAGSGSGSGSGSGISNSRFYGRHVPLIRKGVRPASGSGSGSGEGNITPAAAIPIGTCGPNGELTVGEHYLFKRIGVRPASGSGSGSGGINVIPAAVTVCETCGSGSGSGSGSGGRCRVCNECNWAPAGAPNPLSALFHSPSGGFGDVTVPLSLVTPGTLGWNNYNGIVFPDVPYIGTCTPDWPGDGSHDYYALLVYQGKVEQYYGFGSEVSLAGNICTTGAPIAIADTNTKLLAYAMLANFVYKVGSVVCYSWLLGFSITDYRSPPTIKSLSGQGSTVAGVDCDVPPTPIPSNMLVSCVGTPYFFYASGGIVCTNENSDCDGVTGYAVTTITGMVGHTWEATIT